jgi:adenylate cyclase
MSEDPKQEYFSDGITENLTTDLSQISGFFVISRNSAFTYKGKAVNVKEVGRELGVQHVVEGSVQKAGDRVRINAQLVDATTGHHVWAERYDRELKDIFTLQDEVIQKIVFALKVKLTAEEQARFKRFPTDNLEAYDFFLRGLESIYRFTKEANAQARQLFEKAIALDPQYAGAYARLGWTYWMEWLYHSSQDPQQVLERVVELAQKAVALDDSVLDAHQLLAAVYLWGKNQPEQALAEAERALALDPNYADSYAGLANVLTFVGRPQEAIGMAEKALRLDPRGPPEEASGMAEKAVRLSSMPWYLFELGHAYCLGRRYEEAIVTLQKFLTHYPNLLHAQLFLATAYSELGREEEARAVAAEVLRINPKFSLEVMKQRAPNTDPAVVERQLAALRKAGLK